MVMLLPLLSLAQSVTIHDLMRFTKQPWDVSGKFLTDRSFGLVNSKPIGYNDTLKTYNNMVETIYLGWVERSNNGSPSKEVTYITNQKQLLINMYQQIKDASFEYKNDKLSDNKDFKTVNLENPGYYIQLTMGLSDGAYSSIKVEEK